MKPSDLVFDLTASLGEQLWLVDIYPAFAFVNGKKTDEVIGYNYVILLPQKGLQKIAVKILGKQLIDKPPVYCPVDFDGLSLFVYFMNGRERVGAKANGIRKKAN